MKILTCVRCGGSVVSMSYEDQGPAGENQPHQPLYYSCPLCGPGYQTNTESVDPAELSLLGEPAG